LSLLLVQNHGPNRPGKSDTPISYRLSVINLDCLPRPKHVNNITDLPKPRRDTSRHRRRRPQRFMGTDEIVIHREQRDTAAGIEVLPSVYYEL
jgi:hypothetical protein